MSDVPLSKGHELQVQAFLRFAKFKREQHVREVDGLIEDFTDMKVQDDEVMTSGDVRTLLKELRTEVQDAADKEVENAYQTGALMCKLLLQQADGSNINMWVDTNQLENEYLLRQISASQSTALTLPASAFQRKGGGLQPMGSVTMVSDPRLLTERDELRQQVAQLTERLAKVQGHSSAVMSEKTSLTTQLNDLRDQLQDKEKQGAAAREQLTEQLQSRGDRTSSLEAEARRLQAELAESNRQLASAQQKAAKLQAELSQQAAAMEESEAELRVQKLEAHRAGEQLNTRLSTSKQFAQMKMLLQQKSQEASVLRRKLAAYETDTIPTCDDT